MTSKIKDRLSFKLACIDLIIHLLSNFTRATHYLTLATHSQTMRKSTHTQSLPNVLSFKVLYKCSLSLPCKGSIEKKTTRDFSLIKKIMENNHKRQFDILVCKCHPVYNKKNRNPYIYPTRQPASQPAGRQPHNNPVWTQILGTRKIYAFNHQINIDKYKVVIIESLVNNITLPIISLLFYKKCL